MRKLKKQICDTRYHVSFYLWQIGAVSKHYKFPQYYDLDCLKMFLLLFTLQMMIETSRKSTRLAKKVNSIKKLTISKIENFLSQILT